MRKLIVTEFVTLDGVMQAPGGKDEDRDGGFEHGGWTLPYWHDDIGKTFFELMQGCDAFLLGRRTYVTHAEAFEPLPAGDRPLSGIRVVDVTRVLAGPTGARTLAEHGAEVMKITGAHLPNLGYQEWDTGHGKLSTQLDLRDPGNVEIVRGLVREADVFSQGYRPGTLAGRGLSPDQRAKVSRRGARLDESKPGSGLGLSIVVDLAALYGGSLTLGTAPIGGLRAELVLPGV